MRPRLTLCRPYIHVSGFTYNIWMDYPAGWPCVSATCRQLNYPQWIFFLIHRVRVTLTLVETGRVDTDKLKCFDEHQLALVDV